MRAELLDWSADLPQRQHEVALGCDVLYAHASVEAFSKAVPKLLNKASGILLLADPSDRTKENRSGSLSVPLCMAVPVFMSMPLRMSVPLSMSVPVSMSVPLSMSVSVSMSVPVYWWT